MVLINAFATPLTLSSVNVALPAIASDLALSALSVSWVPLAYLMANAMFILVFGRLADNLGHRRVFLLGCGALLISSVLAALSQNGAWLLSARFLQGFSAAMLYATQMAIVSSIYPGPQRGKAIGMVVAAVYVGLAVGPTLGGVVVEFAGWRVAFLVHLPLSLFVLLIGILRVKQEWRAEQPQPLDIPGAFLYCMWIAMFCGGVSLLPSAWGMVDIVLAALLLMVFLHHARRASNPLWDVTLFFANRVFTYSCAASLLMYSATYANAVLVSLYLQYLKDLPPSTAGLIMMTQPATMALLSPMAGRLSDQYEPRLLASLGMGLTLAGLIVLANLRVESDLALLIIALLLTGVGFSLFSSPNSNAIMSSVQKAHYGAASGALATTRVIGQLVSMALVTLAISIYLGDASLQQETQQRLENAISLSYTLAAVLCLPGIALSLVRGRIHS